jgi:D-amino peptidase
MVGYHAKGGENGNPLAHTVNSRKINRVFLNDQLISEFVINAMIARLEKVPVAFLSGDRQICEDARKLVPGITTVAVKDGIGGAIVSRHPNQVVKEIRRRAGEALSNLTTHIELPETFHAEIEFLDFKDAVSASFYPNAELVSPKSIAFEAEDFFEVLRLFHFVL